VTLAALIGVFSSAAAPEKVHGTLALTKAGQAAVGEACGETTPKTIAGTLDPGDLSASVTKVVVDGGACGTAKGAVTLRLSKGTIAAFRAG
jgi:hypothetical protein